MAIKTGLPTLRTSLWAGRRCWSGPMRKDMSERVSLRHKWPRRSIIQEVVAVVEFLAGRIFARSDLNWFDGSVGWQFLHWAFDMF